LQAEALKKEHIILQKNCDELKLKNVHMEKSKLQEQAHYNETIEQEVSLCDLIFENVTNIASNMVSNIYLFKLHYYIIFYWQAEKSMSCGNWFSLQSLERQLKRL
jgi:hypothetical protein